MLLLEQKACAYFFNERKESRFVHVDVIRHEYASTPWIWF
jgi:hypothetical protein